MKITIIGAGIGGLTLGIALKQKGYSVEIYESAKLFKPVGAGIILGCNAMQVYRALGIDEAIKIKGLSLDKLTITDQKLNALSTVSLDHFVRKYQVGNYAIHRADLHQVLYEQFDENEIILNKKLIKLDPVSNELLFEDGESCHYEMLIGADGIHSVVRSHLFDKQYAIRSAGQMCWRGVVDYQIPESHKSEFREAWGKASRVGFGQINDHQVYWFALIDSKESAESFNGSNWRSHFDSYDPMVKDLLQKTPDSAVHTAPITDLELLDQWYANNVCLIGDAAHAMTPNMGQGAGQAIEDALALARSLSNYPNDVEKAFQDFQNYRKQKVKELVNNSWRIGKMAHVNSSLLGNLRNMLMRFTPASIGIKALEKTFKI